MSKIDDFKEFVRKNPSLISQVKENNMTWQQFYEFYDLYGEELSISKLEADGIVNSVNGHYILTKDGYNKLGLELGKIGIGFESGKDVFCIDSNLSVYYIDADGKIYH